VGCNDSSFETSSNRLKAFNHERPLLADCSHSPMDMLHRSGDTGIGTGTGTAGEQQ
jgi:hypothetical protein